MKPTVLTLSPHYLPGYRGGGPIRSLSSLVETLGDVINFKIIALDRDLGCHEAYSAIRVHEWQAVGKAEVMYVAPERFSWIFLRRTISSTPHDILYLNSFFSIWFGIIPVLLWRFALIPSRLAIIASRGQFSAGAFSLKRYKKMAYVHLVRVLQIHRKSIWQVSSAHETADLRRVFRCGQGSMPPLRTAVAPNLPDFKHFPDRRFSQKEKGKLRLLFLSRLSPKKNLAGALRMIREVRGKIEFNIYGPLEDNEYWHECLQIVNQLPDDKIVCFQGMVNHDQVLSVMAMHELFFLPTLGENYGHVIIEAMAAGCPVLISDRTPWRGLENRGVGWDLALEQPERFTEILQHFVDMDGEELSRYGRSAQEYARCILGDRNTVQQNRDLFFNTL